MASVLWHVSGSSFVSYAFLVFFLLLCPRSTTAREVIDVSLPLQDYFASLPPPPGPFTTAKFSKCDQRFISIPDGPQNGTFHAPNLVNPDGESQQCIFWFIAAPQQRVELVFTEFSLRGSPPDGAAVGELPACVHEYMDLYTEIRSENATKLIETPFGGRYCGPIPPRRRISLYQGIAVSFYTDKNITLPNLFSGRYSFINGSEYEVGTPAPSLPCSFVVNVTVKRTGNILSPTYPGIYPKDLECTYKFVGNPGQRVRLEFRDFDLFFGGIHCPFDYVKVYDGLNKSAAVIGTYCGQQRNLVLYSSEANLFVTFVTLRRTANTQNRGFKGIFEFSESFVKLDFIKTCGGEHMRGTECDQKILSAKESSGVVVSPNYPFPYIPKVVCRYFIYGMQDSQHLERVRLEFETFAITMKDEPPKGDSLCTDGYLKLYLKGQEATDSYDKFDHELCGPTSVPKSVVSEGPRLVMVFSSGENQGKGFKAKYNFETEYKIPGTAAPDGTCTFTYLSSSRKRGEFNSPRYPSNYPSDTNCTYLFIANQNEQVTIVFDHFKVRTRATNLTTGSYGPEICQDDWVEIYNVYRDHTEKLVGRYCGTSAPGPVESNLGALGLKVILHTDQELVFSGFKARYIFQNSKSIFGDCGSNISSLDYGEITSPNYPEKYDGPARHSASKTCNWFISVRPKHQILLHFKHFAVEGEQSVRGCPAAVLRMWYSPDIPPMELCGVKGTKEEWSYLSDDNNMRLSFILADKAVGQDGFEAIWTEVTTNLDCQNKFLCVRSGYCISESLRCNNIDNCGPGDTSDEENCVVEVAEENYSVAAGCAAGAIFVAIILCFACQRKMKRRVREDQIDDMQQQVDDRRHCYHHNHSLLDHQQHHHYQYPQQNHAHSHRNSFSQMDEPALPLSDDSEADQASSPDSV